MLSLTTTLVLLAIAAGLTVIFAWRGARPPDIQRGPRLIPWRPMMVGAAAMAILLLVHLVNLLGVTTGR